MSSPPHPLARTERSARALSVRRYRPGDELAIQKMYETVFGPGRSMDAWRWRFLDVPGSTVIFLLEAGPTVVGHLGFAGFPAWIDGEPGAVALGGDLMVLPEYRRRGGAEQLVEALPSLDSGFDVRLGFPRDAAVRVHARSAASRFLGRLPRWVRWYGRDSRLPAAAQLGPLLRLHGRYASCPRPRLPIEPLVELGAEVDALAAESAAFARCIRVRDAAYLRWRWVSQPDRQWMLRAARDPDGSLRGLVVFGERELPEGRRGRIVDLLARDAGAMRALVCDAAEELERQGCVDVALDYRDPRPWSRTALYRAGFLPVGRGLNVTARWLSDPGRAGTERLADWYLTLGDTDLA